MILNPYFWRHRVSILCILKYLEISLYPINNKHFFSEITNFIKKKRKKYFIRYISNFFYFKQTSLTNFFSEYENTFIWIEMSETDINWWFFCVPGIVFGFLCLTLSLSNSRSYSWFVVKENSIPGISFIAKLKRSIGVSIWSPYGLCRAALPASLFKQPARPSEGPFPWLKVC